MRNIPRCMSTQHPDNATTPFFSDSAILDGETEVKEAFYAYATLGCTEQMWDCEGKEVDNFVVKKLLSNYGYFFSENKLGKDVFLTLRVPNPEIEKNEGKILLETLESIPRNFDAAKAFYGEELPPIFEVIIPMVQGPEILERTAACYEKFVVGKANEKLGDITLAQWIGDFKPEKINIIPLIEDQPSMEKAEKIVGEFIQKKKPEYQRVFLARSDPALNYGSLSAVLIIKSALQRLHALEEETSVEIYPMFGAGSAPFRGNLRPDNAKEFVHSYPSIQTFTIQSAFKYDHPPKEAIAGIEALNSTKRRKPVEVDEERSKEIVEKVSEEYKEQLKILAPLINTIANLVPQRRKRKLHTGLFGYSRKVKAGIKLPRAIRFCASLYSIGIPPEILGLNALSEKDTDYISEIYWGFRQDVSDSLQYLNEENLAKFPELHSKLKDAIKLFDYEVNEEHKTLTKHILKKVEGQHPETVTEEITKAAVIRRFLG